MKDKGIKIKETIIEHVINNRKEYFIVLILFIIGIFLGVLFVNNIDEAQKIEIESYLNNFIENMKSGESVDNIKLLHTSIWQNAVFAISIWFLGTTVIRNPNSFWSNSI